MITMYIPLMQHLMLSSCTACCILSCRSGSCSLESNPGLQSISMVFLSSMAFHLSHETYITVYTCICSDILLYSAIYLKSWACLYMMSLVGVNLFLCSSSRSGRNLPSRVSACVIPLLSCGVGTGRVARNQCISSKPLRSWPSRPSKNLLIASSIPAASDLTKNSSS